MYTRQPAPNKRTVLQLNRSAIPSRGLGLVSRSQDAGWYAEPRFFFRGYGGGQMVAVVAAVTHPHSRRPILYINKKTFILSGGWLSDFHLFIRIT